MINIVTITCNGHEACRDNDMECGIGRCSLSCNNNGCTTSTYINVAAASSFQCSGSDCNPTMNNKEFTAAPTPIPVTSAPTNNPTPSPTATPTNNPSISPTTAPSISPTSAPSISPSTAPTDHPPPSAAVARSTSIPNTNTPNTHSPTTYSPTIVLNDTLIILVSGDEVNITDVLNVINETINEYLGHLNVDYNYKLTIEENDDDVLIVDIIVTSSNMNIVDEYTLIAEIEKDLSDEYGDDVGIKNKFISTTTESNENNKFIKEQDIIYMAMFMMIFLIIFIFLYRLKKKNKSGSSEINVELGALSPQRPTEDDGSVKLEKKKMKTISMDHDVSKSDSDQLYNAQRIITTRGDDESDGEELYMNNNDGVIIPTPTGNENEESRNSDMYTNHNQTETIDNNLTLK